MRVCCQRQRRVSHEKTVLQPIDCNCNHDGGFELIPVCTNAAPTVQYITNTLTPRNPYRAIAHWETLMIRIYSIKKLKNLFRASGEMLQMRNLRGLRGSLE